MRLRPLRDRNAKHADGIAREERSSEEKRFENISHLTVTLYSFVHGGRPYVTVEDASDFFFAGVGRRRSISSGITFSRS